MPEELRRMDWLSLYQAALTECDLQRLPHRIFEAKTAIMATLETQLQVQMSPEEHRCCRMRGMVCVIWRECAPIKDAASETHRSFAQQ